MKKLVIGLFVLATVVFLGNYALDLVGYGSPLPRYITKKWWDRKAYRVETLLEKCHFSLSEDGKESLIVVEDSNGSFVYAIELDIDAYGKFEASEFGDKKSNHTEQCLLLASTYLPSAPELFKNNWVSIGVWGGPPRDSVEPPHLITPADISEDPTNQQSYVRTLEDGTICSVILDQWGAWVLQVKNGAEVVYSSSSNSKENDDGGHFTMSEGESSQAILCFSWAGNDPSTKSEVPESLRKQWRDDAQRSSTSKQ